MRKGNEVSLNGQGVHQMGKMTKENNGRRMGQEQHSVPEKWGEVGYDWIQNVRGGNQSWKGRGGLLRRGRASLGRDWGLILPMAVDHAGCWWE